MSYCGPPRQGISREEYLRRMTIQVLPIYVGNVCLTVEEVEAEGIAPTRERYLQDQLFRIHDETPPCEGTARVLWNSRVHCLDCGVETEIET